MIGFNIIHGEVERRGIRIDAGIADFIEELWDLGVETEYSCEGHYFDPYGHMDGLMSSWGKVRGPHPAYVLFKGHDPSIALSLLETRGMEIVSSRAFDYQEQPRWVVDWLDPTITPEQMIGL